MKETSNTLDDMLDEYEWAKEVLENCGIGGIYDNFHSVGDAIQQMAHYIKELEDKLEEKEWDVSDGPF